MNEQAWEDIARPMAGSLVVLEPLDAGHEEGLYEAAREDRAAWRWLPYDASESRGAFRSWLKEALAASQAGTEAAFATLDARSARLIGSTRYLSLRPEHRGVEIGWTWLSPSAWGTGANVEAKLLMLGRAFGSLGCMRVEFQQRPQRAFASRLGDAPGALRERVPQAQDRATRRDPRHRLLQHH